MRLRYWATLVCALLFVPSLAFGQGVTTSTIRGTVEDESGEPLPGANVVAVHEPTGTQYGTSTNPNGRYTLPNLRVGGPYTVTATFVGFQGQRETGLQLQLGEARRIDFQLAEKTAELEGVEIIADRSTMFDSERLGISREVAGRDLDLQPAVGRTLADFTRLTPNAYVANDDDDGPAISIAGQNNRYNSIFIDGAVSNDVFGLSAQGTNGGQTGATPISIDAIEQVKIDVSPFDVTQSGFAGGAINFVTRSGSNDYSGSAFYYLRDEALAGRTPTEDPSRQRELLPNFSNERYGLRLSGPIVKDKVFFFVSGELLRSSTPQVTQPLDGNLGSLSLPGFESDGNESFLNNFRQFLVDETGYDPGNFGDANSQLDSDKLFAKIDWNINDNHRLTARYNYVESSNVDAFVSDNDDVRFGNSFEQFPNTKHQPVVELRSTFGDRFANKAILTYTSNLDDRGFKGPAFPDTEVAVDSDGDGDDDIDLNFGSEPFSTGNVLEQDIYTFTNNFNWFLGRHTLTFGTHNEFYSIRNLFIPQNFGVYEYGSLDDFVQSVRAINDPNIDPVAPESFERSYSLVDDRIGDASGAAAEFDAFQIGFYVQDEFQVNDRLRLTGGIRVDVPQLVDDPRTPPGVLDDGGTIDQVREQYDLGGARPGQSPDAQFYFQPRLGFNYDVQGDRTTQIRGGAGIFLSRVPFVWPGGAFTNNGATVGRIEDDTGTFGEDQTGETIPFIARPVGDGNADRGLRAEDFGRSAIPSGRLEFFDSDFRYPTVFRTSLGVDQRLPYGFVATLEGQFTKTIDNIDVVNVNLRQDVFETTDGPFEIPIRAGDIFFPDGGAPNGEINRGSNVIDSSFPAIYRVTNTSTGHAYDVTARLQNAFGRIDVAGAKILDDLQMDVSYTYGDSFVLNDGTSSQISSLWSFNETETGLNDLDRTRSDFSLGQRILTSVKMERGGTTVSLLLTAESGRPLSYTIGNSDDLRGDFGGGSSSLFYVPEQASELTFGSDGVPFDAAQQAEVAEQLDRFISNNDYLSEQRGEFAGRNGDRTPFETVLDLHFEQELFGDLGGSDQRLTLTFDIFNLTNLINSDWGRRYSPLSFGAYDVVDFEGFVDAENGDFTPIYSLGFDPEEVTSESDLFDDSIDDSGLYTARWQAQLGLRLTF